MWNKIFLAISATIFTLNLSYAHAGKFNATKKQIQQEALTNVTCQLANELLSKHPHTQDVLIGNLDEKLEPKIIHGIIECIGDDNPIIVADLKADINQNNLRKASVVILVSNKISGIILSKIIIKHQYSKVWHHMAKIICVSINNIDNNEYFSIFRITSQFGFLDFAIVSSGLQNIQVTSVDLTKGKLLTHNKKVNVDIIFPDQLNNLNRHKYRIAVYNQPPLVTIQNRQPRATLTYFLNAVADVQNTSINYIILGHSTNLKHYWVNRQMDLTLNTAFVYSNAPFEKLLTYEETAYCAFAPVNAKYESKDLFLLQPFSSLIWMLLILTIASCVAVWKIFHKRGAVDSHWHIGCALVVTFINQGFNFSNRNHPVLNILFHLVIVLIFILSNVYEGAITSSLIQPAREHQMETFDQVLASNYEIMTEKIFTHAIKDSQDFMAVKSRISDAIDSLGYKYESELKRQHYVFISKCDQLEHELNRIMANGEKISDYYYLLSERIMKSFVRLEASFLNPYIGRLQYYMDLSFQAGLTQVWKRFSSQDMIYNRNIQSSSDQELLDLESIKIVFGILIVGFVSSGFILLVEIFYCNCFRNWNWSNSRKKLRNRIYRMAYKENNRKKFNRLKSRKFRLNRINVLPTNLEV